MEWSERKENKKESHKYQDAQHLAARWRHWIAYFEQDVQSPDGLASVMTSWHGLTSRRRATSGTS